MGGVFSGGCGTGGTAEKQLGLVVLGDLRRSLRRARASFLSFELAERGPDPHSLPSFFQLKLGGVGGEKVAGEEKMIGEVLGLFEGFEELADDFVLELVALDFQLG